MSAKSQTFTVATRGRGTEEITDQVQRAVDASGIAEGLCTVFIHHVRSQWASPPCAIP